MTGACMVKGGMRGEGGVHGEGECAWDALPPTRYGRSMRGWYASYWNAFLFLLQLPQKTPANCKHLHRLAANCDFRNVIK